MMIPLARGSNQGNGFIAQVLAARAVSRDGWRYFPAVGDSRPLTIRGVAETPSHCSTIEALSTDAPRSHVAGTRWPLPKTGVAVLGEAIVERPQDVRAQPDEASRAVARMVVQLVQAADAEISRPPEAGTVSAADRARVPVVLSSFLRDTDGYYYFEAGKRYGRTGYDIFSHGWIAAAGSRYALADVSAQLTDPDYKDVTRLRAAGIVVAAGQRMWIMEAGRYESESYRLYDPSSRSPLLLEVDGGGC
jgi:hypothetical protein